MKGEIIHFVFNFYRSLFFRYSGSHSRGEIVDFLRGYVNGLVTCMASSWPAEDVISAAKQPEIAVTMEQAHNKLRREQRGAWARLAPVLVAFRDGDDTHASKRLFICLELRLHKFFCVALGKGDRPVLTPPLASGLKSKLKLQFMLSKTTLLFELTKKHF